MLCSKRTRRKTKEHEIRGKEIHEFGPKIKNKIEPVMDSMGGAKIRLRSFYFFETVGCGQQLYLMAKPCLLNFLCQKITVIDSTN